MAHTTARRSTNAHRISRAIDSKADKLKFNGSWDQFVGKARSLWGELTDDDVDVVEGNYEQFVGRIKERTGEGIEVIRRKLFGE
jgi:uncharacterized protein YjbJ (UPF0337 family)